jgi:hypothetical protein
MAVVRTIPEPDFTDSRALRIYCNTVRRTLHQAAMHIHVAASELEAALRTVPVTDTSRMTARSVQRRRARQVSRHMKHAAECMVAGSSAAVRTWGEYRRVFLQEGAPVRGRRPAHKVVKE